MAHPSFIIENSKNGQFYFNLTAKNGQIILTSEQYTTKAACLNGIESVKKNANDKSKFEQKTAKNGQFNFVLKAANHQVIGSSELYTSTSGRDNGIKSVMENAPNASIDDRT